tara:strand:- start:5418 stop:7568 length:2151 start_codon:yes stop_codon:yes gene_type:complete
MHPIRLPLICTLLLISRPVSSAETKAADLEADVQTITVTADSPGHSEPRQSSAATPLALSLRDTPQSLTVISKQQLEDQNLQSMRDVLDSTTGVYSYAYDSERVVFTSRGFMVDNVMLDGVPAASNFSTDSIDETLDTALYERIEVVRGATGLMSGAGSPSASVNLVRKHATARNFGVDIDMTSASWNDQRGELDVSMPLTASGNVRARLIGVYQNRESYQDFYEKEKQVIYAIVDADLGERTRLSLGHDYQHTLPQGNTWGSFPLFFADGTRTQWNRSVSTATNWSFWNKRNQSTFAQLEHRFANDWKIRVALDHRDRKDDLALFYVFGYPDPATGEGLFPYAYREKVITRQDAANLMVSGPFALLGRDHELVVGYNGSRTDVDGTEFAHGALADTGNFFEWDGQYPMPEFAEQGDVDARVKTRQNGAYVATRLSLAEPLKLIAGARYSTWKTDYFYIYSGEFKHDHESTTPYAGLIYDIADHYSLFTSYTEIFNPQNALGVNGTYLDPVEGKSLEAGIKGEHFDGRLNTALTLFDTRQDNVAEPAFDEITGDPIFLGDGVTQASIAIDGTQTRGFEMEASGSPLPGMRLSFGWSRYLLEDGNGESVKSYIPRTMVRTFSTWNPQDRLNKLTLGGGVKWQSGSNVDVDGPNGRVDIAQGSVTLVSLMARYQFTDDISVQLNGENLLDKTFYVLDEYGNLYFGEPASASASLRLRF